MSTSRHHGGGFSFVNTSAATQLASLRVVGCTFDRNATVAGSADGGAGGGLYVQGLVQQSIRNSLFVNNRCETNNAAVQPAAGGAYYCQSSGNTTTSTSSVDFVNNTVVQNRLTAAGAAPFVGPNAGCALALEVTDHGTDPVRVDVRNTIVWNNTGTGSVAGLEEVFVVPASFPHVTTTVYDSLVQGGVPGTRVSTDVVAGNANILNADPQFVAPATNDFRIAGDSPAANVGDTSAALCSVSDLSGAARVQGGQVDMGAYEEECAFSFANVLAALDVTNLTCTPDLALAESEAALVLYGGAACLHPPRYEADGMGGRRLLLPCSNPLNGVQWRTPIPIPADAQARVRVRIQLVADAPYEGLAVFFHSDPRGLSPAL